MTRILNVEQAAEKLQLKPMTIREYLRTGKMPGRKIGRAWRILESDLEWFVSGQHHPASAQRVSAMGKFAHVAGVSSEEFARRKQEEIELEDRRYAEGGK